MLLEKSDIDATRRYLLSLVMALAFMPPAVVSQGLPPNQQLKFDNYSLPQGLSQSTVVSLLQDKRGFLWVGTQDGLNRFDGYNFKVYKKLKNESNNSLGGNFIWDLVEDESGVIWIAHDGGISSYNPRLDRFESFPVEAGATTVRSLFLDRKNQLWLGTSGQGLFYFERNTKKTFKYVNASESNLPFNNILDITENEKGELLIGTRGAGLFLFDMGKGFARPGPDRPDLLVENDIWKIQHRGEQLWLGSRKGLIKLNRGYLVEKQFALSQNLQTPKRVSTFLFDEDNYVWIATYGGGLVYLNYENDTYDTYIHSDADAQSLVHDLVFSLLRDRADNLWVGTWLAGMSKLRSSYRNFTCFTNAQVDRPSNFITTGTTINCGSTETLLVGTYGGGIHKALIDRQSGIPLNFERLTSLPPVVSSAVTLVNHLHDGKENLWIGTDDKGVVGIPLSRLACMEPLRDREIIFLNGKIDGSLNNPVKAIEEDAAGNIWIGTIGGGATRILLSSISKELDKTNYVFSERDSTSLSHNRVNDILSDKAGNVWFATSNGLNLFTGHGFERFLSGKIITLAEHTNGDLFVGSEEGLFVRTKKEERFHFKKIPATEGSLVNAIQEDAEGNLWISTNNGLVRYLLKDAKVNIFTSSDGLIDNEYNYNASASSLQRHIFFCGVNGLTAFDPQKISLNEHRPSPIITSVKLNNKDVLPQVDTEVLALNQNGDATGLKLSYNQNNLAFQFSCQDFTNPLKNSFAYQLAGFDNDWVTTNAQNRIATYTNLDPGEYVFNIKASNNDGVWGDHETTFHISINPPPWKTWWAYSGYALGLISLLFLGRQAIVNRERLKAQVSLEQKEKQTLKELDNLKTKFFSNITHEFRTPLTLIQGPTHELLEKTNDPEERKLLTMIKNNSLRLLTLINQLLDLARLDAKQVVLHQKPARLDILLNAIAGQFTSLAQSRAVTWEWHVLEQPTAVWMDEEKVETVVINLISNALKFTPTGGAVRLRAHYATGLLRLEVRDNGRGIPSEKLAHIFDRFYQVEATDSSHSEGTGIGLSLVKEYVELMKGIIQVESMVGMGTTVRVSLPLAETVADVEGNEGNFEGIQGAMTDVIDISDQLPLLLIVEDNTDIRVFIKTCLGSGYRYAEAAHGRAGLDLARHEIPDLIISDLMMPEMDGMQFCQEVKKDIRTNHIPFIMLTAKAAEESKLEGLQSGADDYLTKPFNKAELLLKVRNLVSLREKLQARIKSELLSKASEVAAPSVNEQFVLKAKAFIEAHVKDENLNVETLATEMTLSRVQCYRKILALTGLSPSTFIRKIRLQKASQLLKAKWGPVSQVAYEVGFENLSYFSKAFKEEFGKLPSEYLG